jgi:hypothetical protein
VNDLQRNRVTQQAGSSSYNVDPPLGAIVEEESDIEEPVQREVSVLP